MKKSIGQKNMQLGIKFIVLAIAFVLSISVVTIRANPDIFSPSAAGKMVYGNEKVVIDASNSADGYIMVNYKGNHAGKIKAIIQKNGGTSYTYNIVKHGSYETFPLSEGSGTYKVGVYENIVDAKYAVAYSTNVNAEIKNDYAAFLYPNQYSWFTKDSEVVAVGNKIAGGQEKELDKVAAVYNYIVKNFSYDYDKAKTVKSGYLPNPDEILKVKKGICLDYASVMVAMLRSQGVPTKLVVGYAGNNYHAWISIYVKQVGWVDNVIYFDGTKWKMMDPTFASTSKSKTSFKPKEDIYSTKFVY